MRIQQEVYLVNGIFSPLSMYEKIILLDDFNKFLNELFYTHIDIAVLHSVTTIPQHLEHYSSNL